MSNNKIKYSEPSNYLPKDLIKKYGLGENKSKKTVKKPKSK